jgi:hypothetical protein
MDDKKKDERVVDAGHAESEQFEPDPEIGDVYRSDIQGHGAHSGGEELQRAMREKAAYDLDTLAGDVDAMPEDAAFVGEEAPGGSHPTPDMDVVDEIGEAVGVTYQDTEELGLTEKIAERDQSRWELDPASSEDYNARVNREGDYEIGDE